MPQRSATIIALIGAHSLRVIPGPLHLQARKEVFGSLLVAGNIEAADGKVVVCSCESRAQLESFLVGVDGFFGLSTVGQGRTKAIP